LDLVEHTSRILDADKLRRRIECRRPAGKSAMSTAPHLDLLTKPDRATAIGAFTQARIRELVEAYSREPAKRPRSRDQDTLVCNGVLHSAADPGIKDETTDDEI
jgi:hypothetical protein